MNRKGKIDKKIIPKSSSLLQERARKLTGLRY